MHKAARQALALAIGGAAGYLANWIGMPLPWMLGPMIATTFASLLGIPVFGPNGLRPVVIPILGVMLGAAINWSVFAHIGDWGVTLAIMVPFLASAAAVSILIYRKIAGYDPVTAYFSAMPGGLNDMLILGTAAGGDERRIALAHASRILVVITCVGLFYGFVLGARPGGSGGRPWIAMDVLTLSDWLWLGACAVLGVPFGKLLRAPAPNMLGPMLLSAALHLGEVVETAPPTLIIVMAQIVLGTVIGCRFLGATFREVGRDLGLGALSSFAMLLVAVTFAFIASWLTGIHPSQIFLAYSPGGLTEMSLLALAMGQDVAFVSVMHLLRILLVILGAPFVFGRIGR
jgi:membrane AbrB-like protein